MLIIRLSTNATLIPWLKRAKWGIGANADKDSDIFDSVDQPASGDDDDHNRDKDGGSTHMGAISDRAANRLAEVPQWPERDDSYPKTRQVCICHIAAYQLTSCSTTF